MNEQEADELLQQLETPCTDFGKFLDDNGCDYMIAAIARIGDTPSDHAALVKGAALSNRDFPIAVIPTLLPILKALGGLARYNPIMAEGAGVAVLDLLDTIAEEVVANHNARQGMH